MYTQQRTLHRHSAPCSNSPHAHSGAHKRAPTQSYSNTHTCAGPAAPLTLRTAGDTAQCSGTCLTWELSSPDPQKAPCPESRTRSSITSVLPQPLTPFLHEQWPGRQKSDQSSDRRARPGELQDPGQRESLAWPGTTPTRLSCSLIGLVPTPPQPDSAPCLKPVSHFYSSLTWSRLQPYPCSLLATTREGPTLVDPVHIHPESTKSPL